MTSPRGFPEWLPGDETPGFDARFGTHSVKRRRSGEQSAERLPVRVSPRWPSWSRRWRDSKPTTALSSPTVRSAPPSRTSSTRFPSVTQSLASYVDPSEATWALIHDEVGRLKRLVSDLQELSRAEAKQLTLHPQAVPPAELLERACSRLAGTAHPALACRP